MLCQSVSPSSVDMHIHFNASSLTMIIYYLLSMCTHFLVTSCGIKALQTADNSKIFYVHLDLSPEFQTHRCNFLHLSTWTSNKYLKFNISKCQRFWYNCLPFYYKPKPSPSMPYPPSITRNSIFLSVQAENLGVILDSCLFLHPGFGLLVGPISSIFQMIRIQCLSTTSTTIPWFWPLLFLVCIVVISS